MSAKSPKLAEIAQRIQAHLNRFENDPVINKINARGHHSFWHAGAVDSGPRIFIHYVHYQGASSLTKSEAIKFLEKLDAGFIGTHWAALR